MSAPSRPQAKSSQASGPTTQPQFPPMQRKHPRRVLPENSVSLKQTYRSHSAADSQANYIQGNHGHPTRISVRSQNAARHSSSTQSSAARWFDESNEHVGPGQDGLLDEPPFFLNVPVQDSSPEIEQPPAWGPLESRSLNSENVDLREVIDDLTVENKELKQRLRKFEKSQSPTLNPDKMFELRVHGLSANKQRDLENLLTNFVSKVNSKSRRPPQAGSSTNMSSNQISDSPISHPPKRGLHPPIDSAYVSMSRSGPTSMSHLDPLSNTESVQGRANPKMSSRSRDSNIRSYLHNIPESLVPKNNPLMNEKAKREVVVQRLEHLFTGKMAAPGLHSQPLQQQEVSRSAANPDQTDVPSNRTKAEGSREARIMRGDFSFEMEHNGPSPKRRKENSHFGDSDESASGIENQSSIDSDTPEQRPTRPLDLDIHRAQVPADNLEYIRHLGLDSPPMHEGEGGRNEGWVYLNLLIGMAQLHTINVTPNFIKKSVADMSDKLELSPDGQKIRWKGGEEGTRFFSDSGSNADGTSGSSPDNSTASHFRNSTLPSIGRLAIKGPSVTSSGAKISRQLPGQSTRSKRFGNTSEWLDSTTLSVQQQVKGSNPFDYKPLVLKRRQSSEESEDYLYPEYSPMASGIGPGDNNAQSSNTRARSSSKTSLPHFTSEGTITFYNNALYCTDLAGDRKAIANFNDLRDGDETVLGIRKDSGVDFDDSSRDLLAGDQVQAMHVESLQEDLPALKLVPLSNATQKPQEFQEFEVSGLGGVVPEDNFLVDVRTRHSVESSLKGEPSRKQASSKTYGIVSTDKLDLPPSQLPPPSFVVMPVTSSSYSDLDDTDSDEDSTEPSVDEDRPVPPALMTLLTSGSSEHLPDNDENDDDDSSFDILAAEAIGDILPDEIPAGRPAATAGGGSGYASRDSSPMSVDHMGPPSHKRGISATESMIIGRSRKVSRTET